MLLRIYDVKDFPAHTVLLEIRKGYFMEPENKFATAEERKKKTKRKKEGGGMDGTLQYQVVGKQRDLKRAGEAFKEK